MAARKSPQEAEMIKNHLSKLYLQGFSFRGMSTWLKNNTGLNVTHKTCSAYTTQILDDWHNERVTDVDKWITAELKGLNEVEREAWDAWELSKKDKTKSVKRQRGLHPKKASGGIVTTSVEQYDEVISGVGDPRFLEIIKDCKLQRLQYLNKLKFGGGFNIEDGGVVFNQQIVNIGVVDRKPPPDAQTVIEVPAQ